MYISCTGFTIILAIQHSRIFVGETSKGLSSKSPKCVVETSVLHFFYGPQSTYIPNFMKLTHNVLAIL